MFHFHLVMNLITMKIKFGQLQIYTEQILFVWTVSRQVTIILFYEFMFIFVRSETRAQN